MPGAGAAAARHGQSEGHRHAVKVSQKHSEDHPVDEDGVSRKVRQGREGPEGRAALRHRRQGFLRARSGE